MVIKGGVNGNRKPSKFVPEEGQVLDGEPEENRDFGAGKDRSEANSILKEIRRHTEKISETLSSRKEEMDIGRMADALNESGNDWGDSKSSEVRGQRSGISAFSPTFAKFKSNVTDAARNTRDFGVALASSFFGSESWGAAVGIFNSIKLLTSSLLGVVKSGFLIMKDSLMLIASPLMGLFSAIAGLGKGSAVMGYAAAGMGALGAFTLANAFDNLSSKEDREYFLKNRGASQRSDGTWDISKSKGSSDYGLMQEMLDKNGKLKSAFETGLSNSLYIAFSNFKDKHGKNIVSGLLEEAFGDKAKWAGIIGGVLAAAFITPVVIGGVTGAIAASLGTAAVMGKVALMGSAFVAGWAVGEGISSAGKSLWESFSGWQKRKQHEANINLKPNTELESKISSMADAVSQGMKGGYTARDIQGLEDVYRALTGLGVKDGAHNPQVLKFGRVLAEAYEKSGIRNSNGWYYTNTSKTNTAVLDKVYNLVNSMYNEQGFLQALVTPKPEIMGLMDSWKESAQVASRQQNLGLAARQARIALETTSEKKLKEAIIDSGLPTAIKEFSLTSENAYAQLSEVIASLTKAVKLLSKQTTVPLGG